MKNRAVRICAIIMAVYLLLGTAFYFISGDALHFTVNTTDSVSAKDHVGELLAGQSVTQPLACEFDTLDSVTLTIGTLKRATNDTLTVEILDASGTKITDGESILTETFENADTDFVKEIAVPLNASIQNAKGQLYFVRITSLSGTPENSVTLYFGNAVNTIRGSVPIDGIDETNALSVNGEIQKDDDGELVRLCITAQGKNNHWFGSYYWFFFAGSALLVAALLARVIYCYNKQKKNALLDTVRSIHKYWFLIKQLVARDFKTKYKRSVLGVLWSFLNPLLTMSIQYVIFSTLFGNDIAHFPIYLLSGIVCFNFFSETASMCLMSIVGNASLINKVHVPKYIYPFSRTLSSCINLGLSMLPLIIMMIISRTPITTALFLLPFVFIMLFMVSYGMGLILATLMVFFRDTQFLWGIVSMLLMYLTPIFYSESIIPTWFLPIYKLNPLYHVLRFIRSILIDGVPLEPKAYLYCIVLCAIPLLLGLLVFRKNQNKFIFNI